MQDPALERYERNGRKGGNGCDVVYDMGLP